MAFKKFIPSETKLPDLHQILVGCVSPRPIALVSSLGENGVANLAPYSFFNAFSSNPPTLVFSSNRRVSDGSTKHTLKNAESQEELVINIVSHDIVRQMSLCSIDYDGQTSEFQKSGLSRLPSEKVKAPRVAESPVHFECVVKQVLPLGEEGGAGNLIICEVLCIHVNEHVFDKKQRIDPEKLDTVGRMGRAFYTRASSDIFRIFQPVSQIGMGFDALPEEILQSKLLRGNELAELAAQESLEGTENLWKRVIKSEDLEEKDLNSVEIHEKIKTLIGEGQIPQAWSLIQHLR